MRKVLLLSLVIVAAGCSGGGSTEAGMATTGGTKPTPAPTSGFTSSAVASTAPKATGSAIATKSGKLELSAPQGWMKVDPENKDFQDALGKTLGPSAMAMFKQVASQVDLMAIDLSKKVAFANNLNVIAQPLPKAIASDADFETIFSQVTTSMKMTNLQHKLVKFPVGPALCYSGTIDQGTSKNDLIGYVVPGVGTNAFVITFSTAQGNLEAFRETTESIMQTVTLK